MENRDTLDTEMEMEMEIPLLRGRRGSHMLIRVGNVDDVEQVLYFSIMIFGE